MEPKVGRGRPSRELLNRVHHLYSTGKYTPEQIETEFGLKPDTVVKWAKRYEWRQDHREAIRAEGRAILQQESAAEAGLAEDAPDQDKIRASAAQQAAVVREHRELIGQNMALARAMTLELQTIQKRLPDIGQLIDTAIDQGIDPELLVKLTGAIDVMPRGRAHRALVQNIDSLIAMERTAFDIDQKGDGDNESTLERHLRQIAASQ